MNRLIAWFARNHVAANIFVTVILGAGLLSAFSIRVELLPEVKPRLITVTVPYPGASPEETEQAICVRVEEAIQEVQGLRQITSSAAEGVGIVMAELQTGAKVMDVLDKIKSRVDGIDTFPEEAEEPVVRDVPLEWHVASLAVSGAADEAVLKQIAERVRDELQTTAGVTLVRIPNARPYEVSIEVSEDALRRHGLTFDDVARAIRASSLDLPGGTVKTGTGEIRVRTKEQAYRGRDFEGIVLLSRTDGTRLLLGEVAAVKDGFAEVDLVSRFDGERALILQIFRVGEQNALDVADRVQKYLAQAAPRMPEGIKLTLWEDWSRILRGRLELLLGNARTSLILVFLALALFLRPKLAFWVTMGIPVAFLGAIWVMPAIGVSINLMSLFAFILVLGIVVDDAIVVSENIYRLRRAGVPAQEAAVQGAQEVLIPVWLAVATNILAFTPLLFLPGPMGDFTKAIPIVAILCFSFSILESFVALPAHLSNLSDKPPPRGILGWIPRGQDAVARGLDWFVARLYTPALGAAVRHRYVSLAIGISGLLLTAGLVASGRVKFDFFPPIDADNVVCAISFPVGTPMETTAQALERLEESLDQTREEIEKEAGKPVFRHVMTTVGYHPLKRAQDPNWGANSASFSGSHLGEVNVELIPSEERQLSAGDVARRWRERVGTIAGLQEINFLVSATRGGKPIHIELRSNDLEALPRMAERVKAKLGEYPGVYDASHTYRAGQREVRVSLTPSGRALGLTTADLARQVRQAFHGEEAQRIQRGRDDVRVMVRYPVDERRSLGNLDRMRVRGPGGIEASFGDVAELVHASGPATIDRRDRMRTVTITAELDRTRANANEILADLQKGLLAELSAESPGLAFSFEGEQRDQREMMPNLFKGMVLVNLMIFAILAVTFRSYVQPGLVMLAIPFGVAGAILAHFFLGMNLTVLSTIGIMALMGVVVNDSIVMIEFVNEARAKGMPLFDAILHAGPIRFRPIMLTSLTTFAGLAPLLLEKSLQAQFLIPMVVSLAYGVVLSTAVVLFIVPAAYGILEDVRSGVRRLWQGKKESRIENQESHQAPGITDHSQS